jgi:hypothetical protein
MSEIAVEAVRPRWSAWLYCAVAVGILVLAHGCHGADEDHELFARLTRPVN